MEIPAATDEGTLMYQHLKSGMACLVICAFTLGGWFSWNEELTAEKSQAASSSDVLGSACSYCEGWYRFDDFLKNTGQLEARTIPDIPKSNELTKVQARLCSHIKISGIRVFVRYRKCDPFGPVSDSSTQGPWVELCPDQDDQDRKAPEPKSLLSSSDLRLKPIWNSQITFEQQMQLPEGPHELEFQLVPSPNHRWLPGARVAQGWPVWVGR